MFKCVKTRQCSHFERQRVSAATTLMAHLVITEDPVNGILSKIEGSYLKSTDQFCALPGTPAP